MENLSLLFIYIFFWIYFVQPGDYFQILLNNFHVLFADSFVNSTVKLSSIMTGLHAGKRRRNMYFHADTSRVTRILDGKISSSLIYLRNHHQKLLVHSFHLGTLRLLSKSAQSNLFWAYCRVQNSKVTASKSRVMNDMVDQKSDSSINSAHL